MTFVRNTQKSVDDASADLEASVKEHGFGVLHTYDFKAILSSKGFDLAQECRVFEVCNPELASGILNNDMSVNMALPCRISVYEEAGQTKIGMVRPTELLALISQSEDLAKEAQGVEQTVIEIIEQAI